MSNLIKSSHVISLEDLKRIEQLRMATRPQIISDSAGDTEGESSIDVETQTMKERILQDAQQLADELVRGAQESADQIRSQAAEEAEEWWRARRQEDEQTKEAARQLGYEEGFRQGSEQAERQLAAEWEQKLQDAARIVQQAYTVKESIISEAEQFLVELSCRIAEKVIGRRIEETPELTLEMIAKALTRRKEQGVITLCVAPSQLTLVQAAKAELARSIDSQASLEIVPDPNVEAGGCVIRSAFGSVDARIDTQMAAIQSELLRVAAHSAEARDADGQRD
ncbi:FliH/SctL family protein [Cohnella lubricantis]|uniref:Flagellar assembly protein FliH n=1 Tax=Cohnella lubricantis TaxID=2163172 RepID=A0A841TGC5_9BACL|nr:FliH/SctL family protein [Cohnella lubricantis]MBB6679416.1 flagellar assembly protein FliH [Cohnella lubricantis]MBP2117498.1 flagellar assembly protein FliH [Cohnella lubricantis]